MSLFSNIREASLTFASGSEEYTLLEPWTTDKFFGLIQSQLVIRQMLDPDDWKRWRATHRKTKQLTKFTKDSFSTIGVSGDSAYDLLSALHDDRLFPFVEADLFGAGITIEDMLDGNIPLRTVINVFASLPETCSYQMEISKPYSDWSRSEWMLAEIADLLNSQVSLQSITAQVGGWKPKSNFKFPKPIFVRPAEPEKVKPKMTKTADFVAMLRGKRNG